MSKSILECKKVEEILSAIDELNERGILLRLSQS